MPRNEEGLIAEGDYDARVESTEIKENPTSGNLFIEVGLTVFVDEGQEWMTYGRINLTEKAAGINRSFFHAIGFDPDEDPIILHNDPLKLHGHKTRVKIEHKVSRNGDSFAAVGRFLPPKLEINDKIKQRLSEAADQLKAAKKENANG